MTADEDLKNFFRVPTEFQLRFRELSPDEIQLFQQSTLRPSPYSVMRGEVETLLEGLKYSDAYRSLLERAFQILINIDQRLERLEEDFQNYMAGHEKEVQNFSWFHGELGAGGIFLKDEELVDQELKDSAVYLFDLILPSMPEQRIVCTAQLEKKSGEGRLFVFKTIHEDDREFLHRFVAARERELLRNRGQGT